MAIPKFFSNRSDIRKYKNAKKRLSSLETVSANYDKEIYEATQSYLGEKINQKLRQTRGDVIKKYKTGARLGNASNYSIYDLYQKSPSQIAQIRGVGPKSATLIARCVATYVQEVRNETDNKINLNDNNPYTALIVKKIYQKEQSNLIAENAKQIEQKYNFNDDSILKSAKKATNPLTWPFVSKEDKEKALESMRYIQMLSDSPLLTEIEEQEKKRSETAKAQHNKYWAAFVNEPARYYSILDQTLTSQGTNKEGKKKKEDEAIQGNYLPQYLIEQIEQVKINPQGLKCILRPYQEYGVKYILNGGNVLLGDEMGLGKTIEAIATIVSLKNSGEDYFVVVCPASVLINWEREIKQHSNLRCYVLHGNDFSSSIKKWELSGGVVVINFESAHNFATEKTISLTVVDEAHYIKNPKTNRTNATAKILNKSKRRLFMTGTPLENNIKEMVSLILLLQPKLVDKIYELKQPIDPEKFKKIIAPVYFRRTKDAVWKEMPELQIVEDIIPLTNEERKNYIDCVKEKSRESFFRMRQISFLVDDFNNSSKIQRIKEICDEAYENGRKILIFSFFLNTIDKIKNSIQSNVFGPITGSISPTQRQEIIDGFSKCKGGAVLLSQILAGGTGLNIQQASIVILCEPQYKPSTENQAIARSYRIGQMSNVLVYRLLNEKTVDERILQTLKDKQKLFDAYADKSISGEKSITVDENQLMKEEFENSMIFSENDSETTSTE